MKNWLPVLGIIILTSCAHAPGYVQSRTEESYIPANILGIKDIDARCKTMYNDIEIFLDHDTLAIVVEIDSSWEATDLIIERYVTEQRLELWPGIQAIRKLAGYIEDFLKQNTFPIGERFTDAYLLYSNTRKGPIDYFLSLGNTFYYSKSQLYALIKQYNESVDHWNIRLKGQSSVPFNIQHITIPPSIADRNP